MPVTPRRTRLVRVGDLQVFRRAIAALAVNAVDGDGLAAVPRSLPHTLVVVPTRGAAIQLTRTIDALAPSGPGPRGTGGFDLVTRAELYERLAARLAPPPRLLTSLEREAIVRAVGRAVGPDAQPPFTLRPGLVAEIVRFYDQLQRQGQRVTRFEEILVDSLSADSDFDRGADRMLRQTRFLAAVFRGYESHVGRAAFTDEHALRERLTGEPMAEPVQRVVVSVADWIADPHGLSRADFDLLARLPGLDAIDVVSTIAMLGSGFHQRLHDWLPGIDEVDAEALGVDGRTAAPELQAPGSSDDKPFFTVRDREEELVAIARRLKSELAAPHAHDRIAVVFRQPLPYLYLAREVFGSAGVPYQSLDALPLAAEPSSAAIDLVLECVTTQFTRSSIVALLRSPHFRFEQNGARIERDAVAALDRALADARYLGDLPRLSALHEAWSGPSSAKPALAAAVRIALALQPLLQPARASDQLSRLITFMTDHFARPADEREERTRSALLGILGSLASAHQRHEDVETTIAELVPDIRRAIEDATFAPVSSISGIHLLDNEAARYGEFDDVNIIGLAEGEWPERSRRNIFYPPALLATLGWPSEKDRRSAAVASFLDLVRSARSRVSLYTFTLDDESLVQPSSLVEEIPRAGLRVAAAAPLEPSRAFVEETLSLEPVLLDRLGAPARVWAELRLERTPASDAAFHGEAGRQPSRPWSISAIETYLACPFKFFAQHVLRLEEEPEDDEVMDPKRQGQFIHELFQHFFAAWQASGRGAIGPDDLTEARTLFSDIVEEHVARLPDAEAALERTRFLGSSVAPGLGEIVFRMEAERPVDVIERLLEYKLDGQFTFKGAEGPRRLAVRGVADRLDLLADGTIRVIDYKLSSAPQRSRALQLPIYGLCAEQQLDGHRGRRWTLGDAAYISFRGPKRVTPLFTARADRDQVLSDAQERMVSTVEKIESGCFPPTPDDVFLCGFCSFASVCRKDYVGDV